MIDEPIIIVINIVNNIITINVQNQQSKKNIEKLDLNGWIEITSLYFLLIKPEGDKIW